MELATAICTRSRVRLFSVAALILTLSVSGWAQQAPSTSQKHQAARKQTGAIEYRNREYGFRFTLPESWKGFRLLWSEWQGSVLTTNGELAHVLRGPELQIGHPKWTQENPREDMPILIVTIAQWNESPIVSAAPFGPAELGRNPKYVFAVPPRWDYDFSEGYEEAEKILNSCLPSHICTRKVTSGKITQNPSMSAIALRQLREYIRCWRYILVGERRC